MADEKNAERATDSKGQQHKDAAKSEGGKSPAPSEKSGSGRNDQSENPRR